uniref:Uncharacterized protein n=1 Tax=Lactuca sativa TaxID=4236 RepID=A0A9R1VB82_LACSA|nr:hypothetical protein LSAT_V11C600318710 [Lactuca sativa]
MLNKTFVDTLQRVGAKAELMLYEGKNHTDVFVQSLSIIDFCKFGLQKVQLANENQLVDHYSSKHTKEKPPACKWSLCCLFLFHFHDDDMSSKEMESRRCSKHSDHGLP